MKTQPKSPTTKETIPYNEVTSRGNTVEWKSISNNQVFFRLPGNPPAETLKRIEEKLKSIKWIAYVEITETDAVALATQSSKVRKNFSRYMNRVAMIMIDEITSKHQQSVSLATAPKESHQSKRKPAGFVNKPATAL